MNDVSTKTFWDKKARLYTWFLRKDAAAYAEVCRKNCARMKKSDHALEIAAGTGLIVLTYPDQSFDAVIISSALRIMSNPVRVLSEIRRVLKNDGVLFAPNFTHNGMSFLSRLNVGIAKVVGFLVFSEWSVADYLVFLNQRGFSVPNSAVLNASSPLTYVETIKR